MQVVDKSGLMKMCLSFFKKHTNIINLRIKGAKCNRNSSLKVGTRHTDGVKNSIKRIHICEFHCTQNNGYKLWRHMALNMLSRMYKKFAQITKIFQLLLVDRQKYVLHENDFDTMYK